MRPPKPWPIRDPLGEFDAWVERDQATEAQRWQVLNFLSTLTLNPLNVPQAEIYIDGIDERVAPIPGSRVVVSFTLTRDPNRIWLTRIETAGK